nr:hypothetical protein [Bacteroidota bacterium]
MALNTDKGIVVFGSNWGSGIQLEYNKVIENVYLGWSGIWSMQKIQDRAKYIKHLWSATQKATEENKDFNVVVEELSIDNEFKYLKTWELYTSEGDNWVREDHNKNITAFWKQLHPSIVIYLEEYIDQNGVVKGLDEFNVILKNRKNEFFISEGELNSLGYRLLNKEMVDAKIIVQSTPTVKN